MRIFCAFKTCRLLLVGWKLIDSKSARNLFELVCLAALSMTAAEREWNITTAFA
jgi:hypothetical protein